MHKLIRAVRNGATTDWLGEITARFLARPGKEWRLRLATRMRHVPLPTSFVMFVNIYLREELRSRLLRAWKAASSHHQLRLAAPVVLFRSEEHADNEPEDLGWKALCPHLRVVNVYGGHKTMLRPPHVDDLSEQFIKETNRSKYQ